LGMKLISMGYDGNICLKVQKLGWFTKCRKHMKTMNGNLFQFFWKNNFRSLFSSNPIFSVIGGAN
jgi:hypothetical protein